MEKEVFRMINIQNVETFDIFEKSLEENWKYTDTLYWETVFRKKKKTVNVDLKWYNLEDFKWHAVCSDSIKTIVKNTLQFNTDEELLEYKGTEKYVIIDNKLYIRPRIKITFISGQSRNIYFDNTTKAIEYLADLKKKTDKETLIFC